MSSVGEESFIILDESPSLLEPYSLLQIPNENNTTSFASIRNADLSHDTDDGKIGVGKPIDEHSLLADINDMRLSLITSQTKGSVSPNLAESFLMGAIDRNTMVYMK